ncbi:hypothetical protein SAY87_002989 [Trapa incisa]|uniref:homogentisate 1,2-dioxygenase n=1 Tax=Trapa incisa TaxID=236973 RepID=A0AAN7KEZ0_9MYRT|nr:hypothetical protein SAY87_002989 [Trapa incisa]
MRTQPVAVADFTSYESAYLSGFSNTFSSEPIPRALPQGQNSPLLCPYGLYAEQISGTSFTSPRELNRRTWFYRIKPSVTHEPFKPRVPAHSKLLSEFNQSNSSATPTQLRWKPVEIPDSPTDFVDGAIHYHLTNISALFLRSIPILLFRYTANKSMDKCAFCNADGDFLLVPQKGRLWITTECGRLQVSPDEIVVLPQGFRFAIDLPDGPSRGYVAEIFGTHFQLPDLGPIGANGLAAPRDFLVLPALFEEGTHPVLTAPTEKHGVALLDFVIFPPRWLVAEHTYQPPYYHRNCMSEFMGLILGGYEAKADGFLPGGASLHICMTPHGPDTKTYEATIAQGNEAGPQKLTDTMAFMFESCLIPRVCQWALDSPAIDPDYYRCWIGLRSHFSTEGLMDQIKLD